MSPRALSVAHLLITGTCIGMPPFRPDTREAILPNAKDGRPTPHIFIRLERCEFHGGRGTQPEPAQALIYRCTKTGAERRWGIMPMPGAYKHYESDGGGN